MIGYIASVMTGLARDSIKTELSVFNDESGNFVARLTVGKPATGVRLFESKGLTPHDALYRLGGTLPNRIQDFR